jgi:rhodanese-related sulfurtransferase
MRRALLAACIALVACEPPGTVQEVSREDAMRLASGGAALLLDVRTPAEFESGRVPGAVNVPHTELGTRLAELAAHRDGDVIVYCESGRRAAAAAHLLANGGFTSVRHLAGDMAGWRDAGLSIER